MKRWILSCAVWLGFQGLISAHEGHGVPGQGHTATHFLLEPQHFPAIAITVLAVALLGLLFVKLWKNKTRGLLLTKDPLLDE